MSRRVPRRSRRGGFLWRVLPAASVLFIAILIILAALTYRLTHPAKVPESVNPSSFWLQSSEVMWKARDGKAILGWWIQGRPEAPGIVLAPGYGMSRSDVLGLASLLNQQGYSLLTYDQRGSGAAPRGASTLGLCETDDLLAALDYMKRRPEVDRARVGVWGVDVGARAALRAAAARPEVRVVVADSVYDSVPEFIRLRIREDLGLSFGLLDHGCRGMFELYRMALPVSAHEKLALEALADLKLLLIQGDNRRELARQTEEMYSRILPHKEMIRLPVSWVRNMSGEEVKSYGVQVTDYFRLNLP